jgi:hypothetical protein
MAIYMMSIYGDEALRTWFEGAYKQRGVKLDMGKACVRFKTLAGIPLDVIGEAIAKVPVERYVAIYEKSREGTVDGKPKQPAPLKKGGAKKLPAKKPAKKR